MPDPDDILHTYIVRSVHVGDAAALLAADFAAALDRIDALEAAMRAHVSFGFRRVGIAGSGNKRPEVAPDAL